MDAIEATELVPFDVNLDPARLNRRATEFETKYDDSVKRCDLGNHDKMKFALLPENEGRGGKDMSRKDKANWRDVSRK